MKYPISFVLLLFGIIVGKAQSTNALADLNPVTINLINTTDLPYHPGVFSHFEVIDERPDTARIGIHNFAPFLLHSRNRQLVFHRPASREIADYLNTHFARPGAPYSALIVLRILWLSDANFIKEEKVKNPEIMANRTHIRLKAEIYAFKDSFYIPLVRYDTVQTYKRGNTYNNLVTYYALWDKDLSAVLGDMTDSAAGLAPAGAQRGRHLQREEILQFNRSRFDAEITHATFLTPGVYASFEEFKNNAPSVPHFEIRLEKKDQLLYIRDANGSFYYSHDAWGYCDGRSVFIMRDGKLYPIWKEGKAFYFVGQAYKEIYTPNSPEAAREDQQGIIGTYGYPADSGPPNTTGSEVNVRRIYTVDMDSGAVY
jgi:hypothetical protein